MSEPISQSVNPVSFPKEVKDVEMGHDFLDLALAPLICLMNVFNPRFMGGERGGIFTYLRPAPKQLL